MSAEPPKRSGTEVIKEASRALRGDIAEELRQDTPKFNDQNKQLLKFHGTYQQENRDSRKARRAEGSGKAIHLHGPLQDPRRTGQGGPVPRRGRVGRQVRQRHAAVHHAARASSSTASSRAI